MNENKTNINWYPGHMQKAKREINANLSLVDIVYEVVDARIPISSRIKDVDAIIKNKPRIMIMTKYDLCDKSITDKYIAEYRKMGFIVLAVNLKDNKCKQLIVSKTNELMKDVNEVRILKGLKQREARVLVVGIPNVGKSTLINLLVGGKKALTGNKPGVTKSVSWIKADRSIMLLDTPGILWPKLDDEQIALKLALLSAIRIEVVNKEDIACFAIEILSLKYPKYLMERYSIELNGNVFDVLDAIAYSKKCYYSDGLIDYDKLYDIILSDISNNRFGLICLD